MVLRCWLILLCFIYANASADSSQQIVSIGDLQLRSGEIIHDCNIGYRVAGTLNVDKSNVIVMPTWFTGTTDDLLRYELIGPGKLADTDRYFVISIDALGNGVSSSPSNSPHHPDAKFPAISIHDMVTSQYILLTRHFGIEHLKAVIGISMGGMQTFQWMGQYPEFMDKAVPIDGSPKMTSFDLIQWQTHETAIQMMQNAGINNQGITAFLSRLNLLTLWTPEYFVENIASDELPAFLANSEQQYARMDANDYMSQLRAMIGHDVFAMSNDKQRGYVEIVDAEILVIAVAADHMVNPTPGKALAGSINAAYVEIGTNCGHMGTTCEAEKVAEVVNVFLQ